MTITGSPATAARVAYGIEPSLDQPTPGADLIHHLAAHFSGVPPSPCA